MLHENSCLVESQDPVGYKVLYSLPPTAMTGTNYVEFMTDKTKAFDNDRQDNFFTGEERDFPRGTVLVVQCETNCPQFAYR